MKSVIVTGAGSGIGAAICERLACENFSVVLVGRKKAALEALREKLERPTAHHVLVADVRNPSELRLGLQKLSGALGNLSAVVANAGIGGANAYGEGDRWDEVIATNLTGSYTTAMETMPYLKKSQAEFRNIVFTSSILARLGVPGYAAYCASKAGVLGLMRSLAAEYARDKILVNAICPGWVNTDMAREGVQNFADIAKVSFEEAFRMQMAPVPLRKMSEPAEVASLVRYLIGGEQSSITGQAFDINNGALMS